jgi:hypothetical protein
LLADQYEMIVRIVEQIKMRLSPTSDEDMTETLRETLWENERLKAKVLEQAIAFKNAPAWSNN